MRQNLRQSIIQEIFDSLPGGKSGIRPFPLPEPGAVEVYRQAKKMLDQVAHSPDALLGVIKANFQRLEAGDIDMIYPDRNAAAWLRAMHMLTEVAARLYEQNPYEFSKLEKVANSLNLIEEYIKTNRHCPSELRQ